MSFVLQLVKRFKTAVYCDCEGPVRKPICLSGVTDSPRYDKIQDRNMGSKKTVTYKNICYKLSLARRQDLVLVDDNSLAPFTCPTS